MKHYNIQIYGKVIGVFFREFAKKQAEKLKLTGFVQNGAATVRIEVEGPEFKLEKFVELCHTGPDTAKVDRVEVEFGSLKNYEKFEIK